MKLGLCPKCGNPQTVLNPDGKITEAAVCMNCGTITGATFSIGVDETLSPSEKKELEILRAHIKRIASCHCCNDCGRQGYCSYEPEWGEICAINCPLWTALM